MDTRRSFIKKAGMFGAGAALINTIPETLRRALAIDPAPGSTFYDAEHIVFLMQENRSFDHLYGSLNGVRGFNDPRVNRQPNGDKVWIQTNEAGEAYAPFRLNIHDTKISWMGGLPHSWTDQVDAFNKAQYNNWLIAKKYRTDEGYIPHTMGYHNRQDLPFYYALADSFTICDQHFCSSLTGTTPNRLYFWSGTIRDPKKPSKANVWNGDADLERMVNWKTYPERLEEAGVSWKVYQNEIYADTGLGNAQPWLDNFGDNPLEYLTQFNVFFSPEYRAALPARKERLEKELNEIKLKLVGPGTDAKAIQAKTEAIKKELALVEDHLLKYTEENFQQLSAYQQSIHKKAFTNNRGDEHYHDTTSMEYDDNGKERRVDIPKGDVLYQFRKDVEAGQLPTVSWIAAPEHFSDHPSSAWFGAWYVSEVMDILTKNPEVWKKTIFVLTYDENDGYFDHVPPFTPPHPTEPNTGKVSAGIDLDIEFVKKDQQSSEPGDIRESPIGLGFRVPLIIASPWSRGGYVCSEVFDHTSSLQFLEKFLEKKTGKAIKETNISEWRRAICGDLTSVFRIFDERSNKNSIAVNKDSWIQGINNAQFKQLPAGFKKLNESEKKMINSDKYDLSIMAVQEKGTRPACALPYELYASGRLNTKAEFVITMKAGNELFGPTAAGSPFRVYSLNSAMASLSSRNYAVKAGDQLSDQWSLNDFKDGYYALELHGPNGFYRFFGGDRNDPPFIITEAPVRKKVEKGRMKVEMVLSVQNNSNSREELLVLDNPENTRGRRHLIAPGQTLLIPIGIQQNGGWYDFRLISSVHKFFLQRFAGRIETGQESTTDPWMGGSK